MGAAELGPWEPMPIEEAAALFAPAAFRWWVSGGHALDLHVGRSWRTHDDIDIGVLRRDASRLADVLDGWDIHLGAGGALSPWDGGALDAARSQNNLWCRRSPDEPWCLDLTIGDGDDRSWIYRRDPSIRVPWVDAVLTTADDRPYLAPELQLLFKSKNVRPKDTLDATTVIPIIEPERRAWLGEHLSAEHPWQTIIAPV